MKVLYVRGNRTTVLHGTVTSMNGKTGIVMFDQPAASAYFNMMDGCHVGLGESDWDKAVKFSAAIDLERPIPHPRGRDEQCRIVVCLNTRNTAWAYVWAYESEYWKACDELALAKEKIQEETDKRNREYERKIWQREQAEIKKRQAREVIDSLGLFRIAQAHKFSGEATARPTKLATGPMKLFDLLLAIYQNKVGFTPSEVRGDNDVLTKWIEHQTEGGWEKVEVEVEEMLRVLQVYEGELYLEVIRPLLDRLSVRKQEMVSA